MKPVRRMQFRKSARDEREDANRADRYYATTFGKEPAFQNDLSPKRTRAPIDQASKVEAQKLENDITDDVVDEMRAHGIKVWRNNVGAVHLPSGGMLRYGVCNPGGADYIGIRPVVITQEMVGMTIGQFVGCETKRPKGGEERTAQERFRETVLRLGGTAFVARSREDVHTALRRKK